jgi:uncharacterized membrane protein
MNRIYPRIAQERQQSIWKGYYLLNIALLSHLLLVLMLVYAAVIALFCPILSLILSSLHVSALGLIPEHSERPFNL